jgi:hypothetical protein
MRQLYIQVKSKQRRLITSPRGAKIAAPNLMSALSAEMQTLLQRSAFISVITQPRPTADNRYDNRLAKKLPFADSLSVSISRPGGFPKKRLYSRLNWLGLS